MIRRVAERFERSTEAIRYTIKNFDAEYPQLAVFPNGAGPLDDESKKKIYQQFHRGVSVESLVKNFCRTRTSIYRIINEMRARRIMELPLDFVPHSSFLRLNPQRVLAEQFPASENGTKKKSRSSGLPAYLNSLI